MKPNNEKKIILIGLVTFVICVIFGTGFIISKAIYDKLINYDPSIKIQADAILTMEELGYNETDIQSSGISYENGVDYYMLRMDNTTKMIYDETYMELTVGLQRYENKEDALKNFLSTMTTNKRNSIVNACNKQNPCTFEDTKYITSNNIHEYMIELDVNKWNVDQGYVLYNKENYKEGSAKSNEFYLLKDNIFVGLIMYGPLEFNDDQIQVLSTLFERSEDIFK